MLRQLLLFEESTIISVPMKVVYDVLNTNARLAMFFIRELATDLGTADKRIVSITQKHVRGRLAEALLSLFGYLWCRFRRPNA